MLNFKNLPEQKQFQKGKFIRPGIQNLILRNISLHVSANTNNERPVFDMETEPVTDPGWEGHEGALGQIGRVAGNFNYYLKDESQKADFIGNLKDIMTAVGTYNDFIEAHADGNGNTNFTTLQEVIDAVKPFVVGKTARYFVAAEQYTKLDKSGVGIKLKFPSRRMVESITSETKFPKFDETNPNHFKKVTKTSNDFQKSQPMSDLPF